MSLIPLRVRSAGRAPVAAMLAVVAALAAACGDDSSSATPIDEPLNGYLSAASRLANGWPAETASAAEAAAAADRLAGDVQQVGAHAGEVERAADDADGDEAAALGAVGSAMRATHRSLERRLAALGQDDGWALAVFCDGLQDELAAGVALRDAIDGVIAHYDLKAGPANLLQIEGAPLASMAVCRRAVNASLESVASPAGGIVDGKEAQAERAIAVLRNLAAALDGFAASNRRVVAARDALAELVRLEIDVTEAGMAYERPAGLDDAASAREFLTRNRALFEEYTAANGRFLEAAQALVDDATPQTDG